MPFIVSQKKWNSLEPEVRFVLAAFVSCNSTNFLP
jgi:hypothetical protein